MCDVVFVPHHDVRPCCLPMTGVPSQPDVLSAGILLPAIHAAETFAFSMCNPPFFGSLAEAGQNPATAFGGTAEEMVCAGGELAFLRRMVADSLQLQVSWHEPKANEWRLMTDDWVMIASV